MVKGQLFMLLQNMQLSQEGLQSIFIPARTINCRPSSKNPCAKGMHYVRHFLPLCVYPLFNVDCCLRVVGVAVGWNCRTGCFLEGLVLGSMLELPWWKPGLKTEGY
jgi:hypothetical protein